MNEHINETDEIKKKKKYILIRIYLGRQLTNYFCSTLAMNTAYMRKR